MIRLLWQIVTEFNSKEKRAFLKFVTGCPKPPLGGFDYLQPPFTIRMVSIDSANIDSTKIIKSFFRMNLNNKSGRLPSSSTWYVYVLVDFTAVACVLKFLYSFNLLKLPAYTKKSLLKEKIIYGNCKSATF